MKKNLAIDLGTYSVKFFETKPEGKIQKLLSYEEVPLHRYEGEVYKDMTVQEIQFAIVAKYIAKTEFKGKTITHLSNEMMTTRYLSLPVANRKKAEMMIPFQLEENLPYSLQETHFTSWLHKKGKENFAQVTVTEKEYFGELYKYLNEREILPAVITSELYSLQSYFIQEKIAQSLCFVDIGHETTKVYFIEDGLIVANHTSHIAGKNIDETISNTYNIPLDEAVVYKHENCFFLTENQYQEVNQDQKEFAELMKKTFWPLILELRRWEVGFRVKHGKQIDKVIITGGTTNINNLDNFLSEGLKLPVIHFNAFEKVDYDLIGVDDEMRNSMSICDLMINGQISKTPSPNLLHSEFSSQYSDSIPLHSTAFVGLRVATFATILLIGLFIERVFIQQDISTLDRAIVSQLQSSDLRMTRRVRDSYRTQPQRILNEVRQRYTETSREYESLHITSSFDAMDLLISLHEEIPSNEKVDLKKIFTDGRFVETNFTSEDLSELERLQGHLLELQKNNIFIEIDDSEKEINFSYSIN